LSSGVGVAQKGGDDGDVDIDGLEVGTASRRG